MMPYQTYEISRYRMQDARDRAEVRRLARAARTGAMGAYGSGVIDALGHGLIAIGSRLVSDPTSHPTHRRAA